MIFSMMKNAYGKQYTKCIFDTTKEKLTLKTRLIVSGLEIATQDYSDYLILSHTVLE